LKRRGFFNAASNAVKYTAALVRARDRDASVSVVFDDAQRGNQAFAIE
jgi:hypothetical protein